MNPLACLLILAELVMEPLKGTPTPALPAPLAPKAGASDPRMRTAEFDPSQVVHIRGAFRTATQILFGDDETILHVALGDSSAWDVAAEKNVLFIKPKAEHGPTDLIVTTELKGGQRRSYTFELSIKAGAPGGAKDGLYGLRFIYPGQEKVQAETLISSEQRSLRDKLFALKLDRGALEGRRNLAYTLQGPTSLAPSEVSDNGRFTIMRFPAGEPIPAIYQVKADGAETLVPFDVRGEFVVIHSVASQLRLRQGLLVVCIYNQAKDPYGARLGTHTASRDVDRTDLQGSGGPHPKAEGHP